METGREEDSEIGIARAQFRSHRCRTVSAEAATPFAEGSNDPLHPDWGHADGYDSGDWLETEAEVDDVTVLPHAAA